MKPADRVRRIYERRPYPFGDARALETAAWNLDLSWVRAFGAVQPPGWPARVLVAGCGDGSEAFALQRLLPQAEIVAVDFSARSIALARRLQRRRPGLRRIRFVVADLAAPGLARRTGGRFDFVTCHGVLSYIPRPGRALANFRRCLAPAGVLYLGVNGSRHVGARMRDAFPYLGLRKDAYRDDVHTRAALQLMDAVVAGEGAPGVARLGPGYLASDIFGTPNHCLPVADWVRLAAAAGLHFRNCGSAARHCRRVEEAGQFRTLLPRPRAQVAEILEHLSPGPFHRLLFARTPEPTPPWHGRRPLGRWTVERTDLYRFHFPPAARTVRDRLRPLRVTSRFLRFDIQWQMPEWELEILRRAAPGRTLRQALDELPLAVPFADVRQQFYLLHQLGVIHLRAPSDR